MAQYAIQWITPDGDEDVTIVTGCDLADDAQQTFRETYPERKLRHTFRVSETIASKYRSNSDGTYLEGVPDICEECGEEMVFYPLFSPTGPVAFTEAYGCPNCKWAMPE